MKQPDQKLPKPFFEILSKLSQEKVYGSVEITFQAGEITQITQRRIMKVKS